MDHLESWKAACAIPDSTQGLPDLKVSWWKEASCSRSGWVVAPCSLPLLPIEGRPKLHCNCIYHSRHTDICWCCECCGLWGVVAIIMYLPVWTQVVGCSQSYSHTGRSFGLSLPHFCFIHQWCGVWVRRAKANAFAISKQKFRPIILCDPSLFLVLFLFR